MRPFVWGQCDCCLAVCDALVAMGLPDPAAAYRGRYHCEETARAVMGGSVEDVAEREGARLGWPEVAPTLSRHGDVGVVQNSLMLRLGSRWVGKSLKGIVVTKHVRRAWRPLA